MAVGERALCPVLVGREDELSALEDALLSACRGDGQVVVVAGDAGMGKTRLVRELRGLVEQHATVIQGRCYENAEAAYWPFIELLRSCLEQRPDALKGIGRREADAVLHLLGLGGDRSEQAAEPSGSEQVKLVLGVAAVLCATARRRPLAVVLDDLHWADVPSLELLSHL
ncbi:MAG: ATP-binding protein, partial [Candidatus Methylomirabilaceae bacterium]